MIINHDYPIIFLQHGKSVCVFYSGESEDSGHYRGKLHAQVRIC